MHPQQPGCTLHAFTLQTSHNAIDAQKQVPNLELSHPAAAQHPPLPACAAGAAPSPPPPPAWRSSGRAPRPRWPMLRPSRPAGSEKVESRPTAASGMQGGESGGSLAAAAAAHHGRQRRSGQPGRLHMFVKVGSALEAGQQGPRGRQQWRSNPDPYQDAGGSLGAVCLDQHSTAPPMVPAQARRPGGRRSSDSAARPWAPVQAQRSHCEGSFNEMQTVGEQCGLGNGMGWRPSGRAPPPLPRRAALARWRLASCWSASLFIECVRG